MGRSGVVAVLVTAGVLALGGCGDDGGSGGEEADGSPQFVAGYATTCTDGEGFDGAAAFEPGPDALPVAFLTDLHDEGTFFVLDPGLGEVVAAPELSDPDSDSERARLAATSLVACLDVGSSEPSGATCEYEDDDGDVTSLDVLDVTYWLAVHEARTGEEVDTASIEVAGADVVCPAVMSVDDGEDTFLPNPAVEDLRAALESIAGG